MMLRACVRLALLASPALLLLGLVAASAAANQVPGSRLGAATHSVTLSDLKAAECVGQNDSQPIAGTGTVSGDVGDGLILRGSDAATRSGEGGDDCIAGGNDAQVVDPNAGQLDPSDEVRVR